MLFGLGVDGVVLLYVSHRLALARGLDAARGSASHRRTVEEHVARHVDDSGDVLRADVRGFSESAGARAAGRTQHGGLRTRHAVSRSRHAAAPIARTAQRALVLPGLAAWIARHRTAIIGGSIAATVLLGIAATRIRVNPTLERLRSVTDAAALEARIGSTFGLPGEVSVIVMQGRDLERLLSDK